MKIERSVMTIAGEDFYWIKGITEIYSIHVCTKIGKITLAKMTYSEFHSLIHAMAEHGISSLGVPSVYYSSPKMGGMHIQIYRCPSKEFELIICGEDMNDKDEAV